MEAAWLASADQPLARRLLAALSAGDEAGGDSPRPAVRRAARGQGRCGVRRLSTTSRSTCGSTTTPTRSTELIRLLDLNDLYLTASTEDEKVAVDDALRAELDERAQAPGRADFRAWVGAENYEMRVAEDFSWVDQRVLEILRSGSRPASSRRR